MTTETGGEQIEGFLTTIKASPLDRTNYMVLADYLEERDPTRKYDWIRQFQPDGDAVGYKLLHTMPDPYGNYVWIQFEHVYWHSYTLTRAACPAKVYNTLVLGANMKHFRTRNSVVARLEFCTLNGPVIINWGCAMNSLLREGKDGVFQRVCFSGKP